MVISIEYFEIHETLKFPSRRRVILDASGTRARKTVRDPEKTREIGAGVKNARAFFTFCCTSYTLCTYIQSSNKLT